MKRQVLGLDALADENFSVLIEISHGCVSAKPARTSYCATAPVAIVKRRLSFHYP
jgi:hypothetical protein